MHQTAKGDIEQMKDNILISLKDVVVEFDGQRILKGINLDIHDEEFVTFLGPSGCGKTTTQIGRASCRERVCKQV